MMMFRSSIIPISVPSVLRTSRVAEAAAVVTAAIGLLVLIGWTFHIERLRMLLAGPIVMLPNTAVAFVAGSASLWLARKEGASAAKRRAARTLGGVLFALGMMWLSERLFGWNFGFDTLLFADELARYPFRPLGLMATNSTICITLAGAALLLVDFETRGGLRPSQVFALLGLAIATLALVGHLYGAAPLYAIDQAAGMAIITAVAFATLHLGILFARPDRGGVALITGPDLGGVLARRLLPAALLVPLVLGWLWLKTRDQGLVSREGGIAVLTLLTIGVLTALVLRSAHVLRATDRDRQAVLEREAAATRSAREALATAQTASRAKSDFLAVMSHELRTPLNAIIGYAALLADGVTGSVSDTQRVQLARIKVSASHLVGLIDEILTLSRIEAGREGMRPETVSVARMLDDAGSMAAPLAAEKGLDFRIDAPDDSVTMETDPGKSRQILVNLLSNALKFTERGELELGAFAEGDDVVFQVRDTGIGIAPENLERIFEEFWQVEQSTTRRAGGSGLGLSVSRRLATLLGGSLAVESELGAGSTFTLRLPRRWARAEELDTNDGSREPAERSTGAAVMAGAASDVSRVSPSAR